MTLSEHDMGVLRLADKYGDGLDLSGPRISRMVKAAAKNLLLSGHLCGKVAHLALTELGRAAIKANGG